MKYLLKDKIRVCEFCGKTSDNYKIVKTTRFGGESYFCNTHYYQMVRHGEIKRTGQWKNEIIEHDDYLEIILYDKYQNINGISKVSKRHRQLIDKYKWYRKIYPDRYTDYVITNDEFGKRLRLHALIANRLFGEAPIGHTVDHLNRDGLDNRDENLIYKDQTYQNYNQRIRNDNKSGVKGVCLCKNGYWYAQLKYKHVTLSKLFKKKEDAITLRKHWEHLISINRIDLLEQELKK